MSVQDIPESDLKKLQDYMKEKIKSTKENEKKAPKRPVSDNTPKIKTVSTSSNQGLKTTILLPIAGKNNEVKNFFFPFRYRIFIYLPWVSLKFCNILVT